jgi:hypothetical protein
MSLLGRRGLTATRAGGLRAAVRVQGVVRGELLGHVVVVVLRGRLEAGASA